MLCLSYLHAALPNTHRFRTHSGSNATAVKALGIEHLSGHSVPVSAHAVPVILYLIAISPLVTCVCCISSFLCPLLVLLNTWDICESSVLKEDANSDLLE